MRRTGKEKLHSQRGASLLFAFLFLLVAAMVSAVVIAGAVTAVKRVHDDQGREQSYLTLESASRLLRHMLEKTTVSVTVKINSSGETLSGYPRYTGSGPLGDVIEGAVEALHEEDTAERNFVITVSVPESLSVPESKSFRDVRMDFTVKKDTENSERYEIDGTIQVNDGLSSDDYEQRLFLSTSFFPESSIMPDRDPNQEQEKTTSMTWASVKLYTRKDRVN